MTAPDETVAPDRFRSTKGPRAKTAVIVILVSLGLVAIGAIGVTWTVRDRMFVTTHDVPGSFRVHLHEGTWNLYGLSPRGSGANDTGVDPSVVEIEGPDGPVRVQRPDSWFFPRGSDAYRSVVEFEASRTGDYDIRVDATRAGRVMVAPSVGDFVRALLPWGIVAGVAFLVQLVGWVMLVVGVTRRQRDRRRAWESGQPVFAAAGAPAGPVLPPPGWHPDPYGASRLRWWDGHAWTDEVSQ